MAPDPRSGFNRATVSALPVCQWEWNPPSKGRDHLVGRPWGYQTGAVTSCRVHVRAAARLIARKRGPGGGGDWGNWPGLYPQVGIPSGIFRVARDTAGAFQNPRRTGGRFSGKFPRPLQCDRTSQSLCSALFLGFRLSERGNPFDDFQYFFDVFYGGFGTKQRAAPLLAHLKANQAGLIKLLNT